MRFGDKKRMVAEICEGKRWHTAKSSIWREKYRTMLRERKEGRRRSVRRQGEIETETETKTDIHRDRHRETEMEIETERQRENRGKMEPNKNSDLCR